MNKLIKKVNKAFCEYFDKEPIIIKSPGRVNLIGEHTDYNEGYVLPAAINKVIILALAPNKLGKVRMHALDADGELYEHDLSEPIKNVSGWADYIYGAISELNKEGHEVEGFDCVFGGDIPIGSGLSSSAALTGGIIFGLSEMFNFNLSTLEKTFLAQKVENDFVGVNCGIMDQFASLHGKSGHVIKLDCRSLEYSYHKFSRKDMSIVLCDTRIHRELVSSEYNRRRKDCEDGVNQLNNYVGGLKSLRDVDISMLDTYKEKLDPIIYKRCKYVVEENNRVTKACEDLENNNLVSFGQRMYQSHAGLRDDYEVSCFELDTLVEAARQLDGVYGSRMMGGGFGGCTINLVEEKHLEAFKEKITSAYTAKTGKEIKIYVTQINGGTELIHSRYLEQL
ncbi:MAG: galactokinase [Balneolales bacterium]